MFVPILIQATYYITFTLCWLFCQKSIQKGTNQIKSYRIKSKRRKQLPQRRHDDVFLEESQIIIALISGSHWFIIRGIIWLTNKYHTLVAYVLLWTELQIKIPCMNKFTMIYYYTLNNEVMANIQAMKPHAINCGAGMIPPLLLL